MSWPRATPLAVAAVVLGAVASAVLVHRLVDSAWEPLVRLDETVLSRLNDVAVDVPAVVTACKGVSRLGVPSVYLAVAVVTAALLLWRRRPWSAAFTLVSIGVGLQLAPLLKGTVRRPRPDLVDPVAGAGGFSFPSGHAVAVTVVALTLLVVLHPIVRTDAARTTVVGLAVAAVVVVGLARLVLGVHYLTDVVAGVLVGTAWVALVWLVFRPLIVREQAARTDAVVPVGRGGTY